jgi:hypothetical protein
MRRQVSSILQYEAAMTLILITIGILVAIFAASYVVEGFRQRPVTPEKLYWAPHLPIQYTEIVRFGSL